MLIVMLMGRRVKLEKLKTEEMEAIATATAIADAPVLTGRWWITTFLASCWSRIKG